MQFGQLREYLTQTTRNYVANVSVSIFKYFSKHIVGWQAFEEKVPFFDGCAARMINAHRANSWSVK